MAIQLTEKQANAFECMKNGNNTFLTGPGGTGKSFLLKCFIEWYRKTKNMIEQKYILRVLLDYLPY